MNKNKEKTRPKKLNPERCVLCGGQIDELYAERIWDLAAIICEDILDDRELECQELIYDTIRSYSKDESRQAYCDKENNKNSKNGEIV